MNLVNGEIISDYECDRVLLNLDRLIFETLQKPSLDIDLLINACDYMVKNIDSFSILSRLPEFGIDERLANIFIEQIKQMLSADSLRKRLHVELGTDFNKPKTLTYLSGDTAMQTVSPLGVLFHITAGNVDGLPFVSLLDGLLAGNINIVKLPKEEGGITVALLLELFKIVPQLKEFVYVFDYTSKDISAMTRLAKIANAVVVWGGDEAVSAVRKMVDPNTKIIEWGHKISFAYITKSGADQQQLEKLALQICITNQLFCSSCQGIFLDTDDMYDVYDFCDKFLPVLEKVSQNNQTHSVAEKLFADAGATMQLYTKQIEERRNESRLFKGRYCSLYTQPDSKLEPSVMNRNLWVKPLKKDDILNLRIYKNYLQTAALICGDDEYGCLSEKLLKAGLVKISDGLQMSNYAPCEAHDGVFPLRCYTKIVSVQQRK